MRHTTPAILGSQLLALVMLVQGGCTRAERTKTGILVHNASGQSITVTVAFDGTQQNTRICDQHGALVFWDFAKSKRRDPELHSRFDRIEVTDRTGRRLVLKRRQLMETAGWDRHSRRWILSIGPGLKAYGK